MTDNFPKYKRPKNPHFQRAQTTPSVIKSTHTHTHTHSIQTAENQNQEAIFKAAYLKKKEAAAAAHNTQKNKDKNITSSETVRVRRQWVSSEH